ncbi:MAG: OmpW family outer membrane protein [Parvibaculum sp.]|jgi:outer membrane protein|uniref:OmpW/AlkL family protein n=1 Tax=Parvibaculum sp. TaxID=2024848 RepID=UPI00284F9DF4|nr:OmpW family outer membrane protein [Parvibaculum sp.]MDR3499507.1 OmpW family outer membrane protein [Parvibaculum sp.]
MSGNKTSKYAAIALAALLGSTALATAASADDTGFKTKSAGDFVVRLRGLYVMPRDNADVSAGGSTDISNDFVPEVDGSYFITDNIALELIAATTRHKVTWTPSGTSLGKVSLLPPTLTAQYHFLPKERFSPYLGAGLNYTFFFNEDAPGGAIHNVSYQNHIGYALQAGVDYALVGNWSLNLDVKKIFLRTDVSVNGGAVTAKVNLDPWIIGAGVGYRF